MRNIFQTRVIIYTIIITSLFIRMTHYRQFEPISNSIPILTDIKVTSSQKRLCEDTKTHKLYAYKTYTQLDDDSVYKIIGSLEPPEPQRNPGGFSQFKYYKNKRITGTLIIKSITFSHQDRSLFQSLINTIHNRVLVIYQQLPSPYYEIFTGLIIGDQKVKMPHSYKLQFVRTGLIHLIVVSGSQVSLLTGILIFLCNIFKTYGFTRFLLINTMTIVFYFITGGGPSIMRAVIMNCIALSMEYSSFKTHIIYKLLFLLVVHCFIFPGLFWDIGAQLSYITTLSMIFFVPLLKEKIQELYSFSDYLAEIFALTLAPFILTTPLLLYQFHSISLVSLISNLIIPPLLEWLVTLGIIITPFGLLIKEITIPFLNGFKLLIKFMLTVMDGLDSLSFAMLYTEGISVFILILLYVLIFNVFFLKLPYKHHYTISIICILLFSFLTPRFKNNDLECYFLDVGQGDCTVIITPSKKVIVVDTGPQGRYKSPAETIILPFLQSKGINHIDCIIITHYDLDHYAGLDYLTSHCPVSLVIDNGSPKRLPLKEALSLQPVRQAVSDHVLVIDDDVSLVFMNTDFNNQTSENNNSLVFKLVYKNFECLFTGDLEKEGEHYLVDTYSSNLLSDVYKAGHHGSKTSSTLPFIETVRPNLSVVSAGINNRYHHPSPSVVDRLKNKQSTVVQTLVNGAVILKTNGVRGYYRTFLLATTD